MANESSGKKALKAGLGYTVGNMLVKGLSFLAIPLFARWRTSAFTAPSAPMS